MECGFDFNSLGGEDVLDPTADGSCTFQLIEPFVIIYIYVVTTSSHY